MFVCSLIHFHTHSSHFAQLSLPSFFELLFSSCSCVLFPRLAHEKQVCFSQAVSLFRIFFFLFESESEPERANPEIVWTQKGYADAFLVAGPVSLLFFPLLTLMPIDSCLRKRQEATNGFIAVVLPGGCVAGWLSLSVPVSHLLFVSLSSCLFALLLPGIPVSFCSTLPLLFFPRMKVCMLTCL